jgi:hypothetical protein
VGGWVGGWVGGPSPGALRTVHRRRLHAADPLLGFARVRCAHPVHKAAKTVRCGVIGHCVFLSRCPPFDVRNIGGIPSSQSRFRVESVLRADAIDAASAGDENYVSAKRHRGTAGWVS